MLKKPPFGFNLIRKYNVAFGSLFNEIKITHRAEPHSGKNFAVDADDEGDILQEFKVPLTYAHKDKLLARVDADPNIDKKAAVTLPWISFEMSDMQYNPRIKLGSVRRYNVDKNRNVGISKEILNPVPYTLTYKVWVFAKTQADGNQIIEQIIPYFSPSFPMTLDIIPEIIEPLDCPVTLHSVSCEDLYNGNFADRRSIVWTLNFTMIAYFFGPIRRKPVIKFVEANFLIPQVEDIYDAVGKTDPCDRVTVQPGLDANGNPTTDITKTVPYQQVYADDDWAYLIRVAGNLDPSDGTGGE